MMMLEFNSFLKDVLYFFDIISKSFVTLTYYFYYYYIVQWHIFFYIWRSQTHLFFKIITTTTNHSLNEMNNVDIIFFKSLWNIFNIIKENTCQNLNWKISSFNKLTSLFLFIGFYIWSLYSINWLIFWNEEETNISCTVLLCNNRSTKTCIRILL